MFALIFAMIAVALMFAPPPWRKIGLGIVGAVLGVFLVTIMVNRRPLPPAVTNSGPREPPLAGSRRFDFSKYERDKRDKEDPEAKTRIPLAEVRFDQIQPVRGVEKGTIQSLHARLYNDSPQFLLTDHSYYLIVEDCLTSQHENAESRCTAVYDQRDWMSVTVPPGQARDVVISLPSFPPPFKLLGTPRLQLTVTDTRSYRTRD